MTTIHDYSGNADPERKAAAAGALQATNERIAARRAAAEARRAGVR